MDVDFGGLAAFVTQKFLNIPEVGSRFQQMGCTTKGKIFVKPTVNK